MDVTDLLYTNSFVNTQSLTKQQLEKDANEFVPYRTLKGSVVNNVRDELERTAFTDNPLVQRELKSYGWNRGTLGNQKPILSDFARDIASSTYYRYKTTYLNIDSRMRDVSLYPTPNNYFVFLGKKFDNVETIKLIDYFFPNIDNVINKRNNVLMWFTIPYEMIQLTKNDKDTIPFTFSTGGLNVCSWYTNFNNLVKNILDCGTSNEVFTNNIYKNLFTIEIPPGNYTTEELALQIQELWSEQQFFNSNYITTDAYNAPSGSPTLQFYQKPQLVKVRINPENYLVDMTLRYEEIKIKSVRSYIGKNYMDVLLNVIDETISSPEYLEFLQNTVYPLIPTGFPGIGGLKEGNINYVEFITRNYFEMAVAEGLTNKTYYDIVRNPDTNEPIPNILRLYFYNTYGQPILFSYSELYQGSILSEALIGREAPYFLINSTESPLFAYLTQINNFSLNLNPTACFLPCLFEEPTCTTVVKQDVVMKINATICNLDGSSKLITNLLGYENTDNNKALIGPLLYSRAIQGNIIYKGNVLTSTLQTITLDEQRSIDYINCQKDAGNIYVVNLNYSAGKFLNFKLPITKNPNGTYSFYTENYFFLKLLNPIFNNQTTVSEIIQVKPTPYFANGSSDRYEYDGNKINGFEVNVIPKIITNPEADCNSPETNEATSAQANQAIKNLQNLFAKIKISGVAGSYVVNDAFTNELLYFDGSLSNLDSFTVQLVDYEGKVLEVSRNHNFTLMIVEKIEVLKETNINSRTGFANSTGTQNVVRNNFSTS